MILYPPILEDMIPAFTNEKIIIPFYQNPAVNISEVVSFRLIVRDYNSSNEIGVLTVAANTMLNYDKDKKTGEVTFIPNNLNLNKNQYYKFQMAYSDDYTNYYAFSSPATGKYIENKPLVFVLGLNNQPQFNLGAKSYTGVFQTDNFSELLYSYRFILKEATTDKIVEDSGIVIYNIENDIFSEDTIIPNSKRVSQNYFKTHYEIDKNKNYILLYEITTINGYTDKVEYNIVSENKIDSYFTGSVITEQDVKAKDNGYINIYLDGNACCNGNFILERSFDNKHWEELTHFTMVEQDYQELGKYGKFVWQDYSIEHGVEYVYAISQYADNVYSERIKSNPCKAEFDDMFLSDGERTLKIKYNPKVSSFKDVVLEQKIDTLGGQYPFFFRNNQIKYKEIPISGLISYLMDENESFMNKLELGITQPTINLTSENFAAERRFKLAVLDWLNNGELKLFRSPAEGNYVVRLMNVSLAPQETLSRMLHTFSATGYESAAADIDTLIDKNIIRYQETKTYTVKETKKFSDIIWPSNSVFKIEPVQGKNVIKNIIWTATPDTNIVITLTKEDAVVKENKTITQFNGEAYNLDTYGGVTKFAEATISEITENSILITPIPALKDQYGGIVSIGIGNIQVDIEEWKKYSKGDIISFQVINKTTLLYEISKSTVIESPETISLNNITGEVATPKEELYNSITLYEPYEGYNGEISYEYIIDLNNINDDFKNQIYNTHNEWISILDGQDLPEDIEAIHILTVEKNENASLNYLKIGDNTINCSDGQIRYFYDINKNDLISFKGVQINLYARVKGAESNV